MTLIAAEGRLAYGACMQVCAFDPFISSVIVIIIICDQFSDKEQRKEGGGKKKKRTLHQLMTKVMGGAIVTFCLFFFP